MKKSRLLGALCACLTTLTILFASNAEAQLILIDQNNSGYTNIYSAGFDVTTQTITSSATFSNNILGRLTGVTAYNGSFFSLGLNDELFAQPGSIGTANYLGSMAVGDFDGLDIYNGTRYLLGLNGEVFANTAYTDINNIGTLRGYVHSGFVDITTDGTNWYGLTQGGHIYRTSIETIGNTSLGVDLGYVGSTYSGSGWDGIAYFADPVILPPSEVPVPAAVWLFVSGLLGLVGIARRKKAT